MGLMQTLALYWQYPFVRSALTVGVLIALCASLLGVPLVLRRFSFIGDGLSHAAFGAMAVASVLNLAGEMPFVLGVTVVCAVLLLRAGQNASLRGDAATAMLSVGAMAVGYLLMNLFGTSANLSGDVCATLFGATSILTLTAGEVWLSAALALGITAVFALFYHRIFAVTFDEDFARAAGVGAKACNLLLAVSAAVVIVLAMNLVGSLLVTGLVVFPALAAMRVCGSFGGVTLCAALFAVGCAAAGILIAVVAGTPVGSTIVAVEIAVWGLFWLAGKRRRA